MKGDRGEEGENEKRKIMVENECVELCIMSVCVRNSAVVLRSFFFLLYGAYSLSLSLSHTKINK